MKSIRYQLLLWLLPSFILIAFLASSSLYFSEKLRLDTNLDNELSKIVRAVKLTNNMPRNRFGGSVRMQKNIAEQTNLMLANESSEFYLQIWNEEGKILEKSENLKEQELSYSNSPVISKSNSDKSASYNSKLTSGTIIRVHSFSMRGGPRSGGKKVSIAMSKQVINQQLAKFAVKLIIGGLFCCFLLSGILIFAIRRTLRPIQMLSEQVAKVEAGTLHNRLNLLNVPAEISPLVKRLNQLLERLEQSFDRERQFNNDLAHELRTPLAAIRTTSEVALKWPEQSSIEDHQYIVESSAQLQNTIDSLLSLARIENSRERILIEKVNIAIIVNECIALQASLIKERNITITLSRDKQCFIQSSPHLLRIILSNLISNAVEYAPINSEVFIKAVSSDSILSVVNMAPNLNEADIISMFDRLWRKDDSRTGTKHVGLGLSIAHTAAQALSLELTAELYNNKTIEMRLK
jgi:signal transduction histidine kinase